jgi:uncharacterized protein YndB with AHSA1/START domain
MSDPLSLQVKRVIKASPADLFEAWTKPELMQKWFAPPPMTVESATQDLRVGGAYSIKVLKGSGTLHVEGTYKQIIPNKLLAFTWTPCSESPSYETLVTVEFKEGSGNPEAVAKHEFGWNGCLDNLAKVTEPVTV